MPSSKETPGGAVRQVPLAVVTAREPVAGNRWIEERWKVVGAVTAAAAGGGIARRLLRAGSEGERYLWSGLTLRLHPSEADAYYYNIIGQNPSLYVYCETDEAGEPCPRSVTAEYIDAMAYTEGGNVSFAVPMPAEVYRIVEQFVVEHFVPEERKLRRKRDNKLGEAWDGE